VEHRVTKHDDSMYEPDASLARMDAIAAARLSSQSLTRYQAYKQVLLAREQDHAAIVSTLKLFVSDLAEASGRGAVISNRGNGT
jgi:hypothetical protein